MFVTICMTVIVCFLVFEVYIEYLARRRAEDEARRLRAENDDLRARNARYFERENQRLMRINYQRGKEHAGSDRKGGAPIIIYGESEDGDNT